MDRTILHCDLNSFFASVEELYHPEYRGLPLAVGGDRENRHGIILAANQIAKKYKVKTAETIWQAKLKCPDLIIVPASYHRYIDVSKQVRQIFLSYTDLMEPFGIDEAWLDVSGSSRFGNGIQIANLLRERIRTQLGITASVGVSFNKIMAKLGSDLRKPDYTTVIKREDLPAKVWPLPASSMLFVGKRTARILEEAGIKTIGDLAHSDERQLSRLLGKAGSMLWRYANGNEDSPVMRYDHVEEVKSVGNSVTGYRDLSSSQDVHGVLLMLADSVGTRLRKQNLKARGISVSLRDRILQVSSKQIMLSEPTDSTDEIYRTAIMLYSQMHNDSDLRSAGIRAFSLSHDTGSQQLNLFSDTDKQLKEYRIDRVMDEIRSRYGSESICRAGIMIDPRLTGHIRHDD